MECWICYSPIENCGVVALSLITHASNPHAYDLITLKL